MPQGQHIFDTLKYVDYLENHGFSEKQAKGLLEATTMVVEAQEANMATKHDLELATMRLGHKIDRSVFRATVFLFTSLVGVVGIAVAVIIATLNYML